MSSLCICGCKQGTEAGCCGRKVSVGSGAAGSPIKHSLGQEGVYRWQRKIRSFPGMRRSALRGARMLGDARA